MGWPLPTGGDDRAASTPVPAAGLLPSPATMLQPLLAVAAVLPCDSAPLVLLAVRREMLLPLLLWVLLPVLVLPLEDEKDASYSIPTASAAPLPASRVAVGARLPLLPLAQELPLAGA